MTCVAQTGGDSRLPAVGNQTIESDFKRSGSQRCAPVAFFAFGFVAAAFAFAVFEARRPLAIEVGNVSSRIDLNSLDLAP